MKNSSFDKSIKQQLEGHEAPVPADAWANIQKGKRKRRPWVFFWLLGALLLSGGISLYFLNDPNHLKAVLPGTIHKDNTLADAGQKGTAAKSMNNKYAMDTNDIVPGAATNNLLTTKELPVANTITPDGENTNTANTRSGITVSKIFSFKNKKTNTELVKNEDAATEDESISPGKKNISHMERGFRATIKVPEAKEEDHPPLDEIAKSETTETVVDKRETIPAAEKQKDSLPVDILTEGNQQDSLSTAESEQQPGKKMQKPGLSLAFSASPFVPLSNFNKPDFIQRTLETPMNRAEFTATDISIRRHSAVSFTALVKKGISAKIQGGVGVSYTVIKEYIKLKGVETNTVLSVVKRLQNGNQLVDDTLSVTSTGLRTIDAVNSYQFLSIPLSLQYQLSRGREWELALQAGLDINLSSQYRNAIAGKLIPYYGSGNPVPAENKSMGVGFYTGLYIARELGKRYGIFASPYLQWNPSKINLTGMPAAGKISRAGIGFGVHYRL